MNLQKQHYFCSPFESPCSPLGALGVGGGVMQTFYHYITSCAIDFHLKYTDKSFITTYEKPQ